MNTIRLFCFPYAGGSAHVYRKWSTDLPKAIEVHPIELPGRGTRLKEKPFHRMAPLVKSLANTVRFRLDKPFAFFGHSLGALIAFELTRYLRREQGPHPCHLFVSGHQAPQVADSDPPISSLSDKAFKERLRSYNGTPHEVLEHTELMELMLPILRTDFEVNETYVYSRENPLECPVTALGGLQDHAVSRKSLEAWHEETSSSFMVRLFPGDHFYLNKDPLLLLQAIAQELLANLLPSP